MTAAPNPAGGDAGMEAWAVRGAALTKARADSRWDLAYWCGEGFDRWGLSARETAAKIGISPEKFSNYLAVSRAYRNFAPRKSVDFTHHLEAARLEEADRERILDAAEAGAWTRDQTRAAVREASTERRLRRRIADLEEALSRSEAAGELVRLEQTADDSMRSVERAWRDVEDAAQAFFKAGGPVDSLHGNAARTARKRVRGRIERRVARANAIAARVDALLGDDR